MPDSCDEACAALLLPFAQDCMGMNINGVGHRRAQTSPFDGIVAQCQAAACRNVDCGSSGSCSGGSCVCSDGYTGRNCQTCAGGYDGAACVDAAGFAPTYRLTGCANRGHCGTFIRDDETQCDGAPTYRLNGAADGLVLFRLHDSWDVFWVVADTVTVFPGDGQCEGSELFLRSSSDAPHHNSWCARGPVDSQGNPTHGPNNLGTNCFAETRGASYQGRTGFYMEPPTAAGYDARQGWRDMDAIRDSGSFGREGGIHVIACPSTGCPPPPSGAVLLLEGGGTAVVLSFHNYVLDFNGYYQADGTDTDGNGPQYCKQGDCDSYKIFTRMSLGSYDVAAASYQYPDGQPDGWTMEWYHERRGRTHGDNCYYSEHSRDTPPTDGWVGRDGPDPVPTLRWLE